MNPEALWAKVIKAIHESKRSKKHIPIDNRNAGIWKDVVAEDKELDSKGLKLKEKLVVKLGNGTKTKFWLDNWAGGMPFADKYPDLFKIVKNKDAKVADLAIRLENENQWNIEWSRPPNNDGEWAQWSGMLCDLNKATFNNGEDCWGWMTDKLLEFSIAIIKDQLMKFTASEHEERWQHWNTWVPAKVNYFTWRTAIGRIPVKSELRKRGLKTVWWNILAWMKLPTSTVVRSIEEIMGYINGLAGSQGWKKTVNLACQATIWNLWKARNEREFRGIARSGNNIVEDIKADTFLWLKSRSKFKELVWERRWKEQDPVDCMEQNDKTKKVWRTLNRRLAKYKPSSIGKVGMEI
ncbi:uncharacterized protein LOC110892949 [Helianthus annuus]|uniref:uncharacterized protein LOC110892949 n=1 Tax=Helianthus annuus TaxID=4232 RepID=UPI000B9051F6|nr:uncharacterized protein LOC110892949 [Helianthus annuus]